LVAVLLALMLAAVAPARAVAAQPPASADVAVRKPTSAQSAAVEQRLSEALRRSPDSFDAHYQLASFYLQQGKLQAALPHLERALAIDPAHYAGGHDLALALLETGELDEARAQITRMLGARETAELHNLFGDVEERAGNVDGAAEAYQRAAQMAPTEEHLFDWGNNLLQLRSFEEATQIFATAIARDPRSARLYIGLGIARYSRGQYEEAVSSFCQAADLAPADPRPYQFLGEMYGVAPALGGEVTTRLARFAKAQPRNALAQFHYAMSLWKGLPAAPPPADMRRVEALLRRAVALDNRLTKGFLELGILLSDERRYKEAILELRRATRLEPDLAQAHYRLAQAYQRTGQKALAAKELETFERLTGRTSPIERQPPNETKRHHEDTKAHEEHEEDEI
jgi:tetratricopeptide (TPR) repeat protein